MKKEEVDKRYLSSNKVLCRFAGVWPYQTKISRKVARTFVYTISLSAIYTMILRVILFFSPDILIEQCPFLVAASGILVKLVNYALNYDKLEGLVNGMYSDWDTNRPPAETEIMDVYGKRGVFFTIAYMVTALFGTIVFIIMPTAAGIVEYFARTENGTVYRYYIYPAYYPFDEDRYYICFWTHMAVVICVVSIVYTACDTLYMYGVQHACGLLAVAGFIQDIHELHSTYLAIIVVLVITAFSITLVKMSLTEVGFEFYKYLGFLVVQLIHLFFLTSQGQFVQNAYDELYNEMYGGHWYNSSCKTQMLYLLALRGSLTAPVLTAGGLLPLTLETFAEVLKASVSYFTVLKSQ
ncbi:uncharacterized protein LOC143367223 [Andrena cerasifolii]|uniref:uncharacterized protein LOC143367223 n=1 Tax=Andrena cerasifolii TaxID=2819439 RepID=UPI00403849C5